MRHVEPGLPVMVGAPMLPDMFVVTEEDAAAIRDIAGWKPLPVKPRLVRLPGKRQ
jgi:hypothetical protein